MNDTSRRLTFEVFRFNPQDPGSAPHIDTFEIEEVPYMSLFMALNEIRETLDPSLQFDFACRSAICGSCGMMVNGNPALGCRTQTSDLPDLIRLHPLPVFKLVGDLSVDTGTWFREMAEKSEAWIHAEKAFDPEAVEDRMDDELAQQIYDSDRCIECGCCDIVCPSHIPLTSRLRTMKSRLAAHRGHEAIASAAQARYDEHIAREARAAAEERQRQIELTAPLDGDDASRRAAIEAAIARADARRKHRENGE